MQRAEAIDLVGKAAAQLADACEGDFTRLRDSIERGLARLDSYHAAILGEPRPETALGMQEQLANFTSGIIQVAAAATAMLEVMPLRREDAGAFLIKKTARDRRGD